MQSGGKGQRVLELAVRQGGTLLDPDLDGQRATVLERNVLACIDVLHLLTATGQIDIDMAQLHSPTSTMMRYVASGSTSKSLVCQPTM